MGTENEELSSEELTRLAEQAKDMEDEEAAEEAFLEAGTRDDPDAGFKPEETEALEEDKPEEPKAEDDPEEDPKGEDDKSEEDVPAEDKPKEEPKPELTAEERFNQIQTRMRRMEGYFGDLNSQLQNLMKTAKDEVSGDAKTPSPEAMKEAQQSSEKMEELKSEFPEWADAFDEQVNLVENRIQGKTVEQVSKKVEEEISSLTDRITDEVERRITEKEIDKARPGWKTTVKSEEFNEWFDAQDEETQKLAESDEVGDALSLLDKFEAYRNPDKDQEEEADRKASKQQRLEDNVEPTGSASRRTQKPTSEEDDFLGGFKKERGMI